MLTALFFSMFLMTDPSPDVKITETNTLPALPAQNTSTEAYQQCLARVDEDPAAAKEFALNWTLVGGDAAATHCVAMADLALGNLRFSAGRVLQLADEERQKDTIVAASLYHQGAEILLAIPDATMALEAANAGLEIAPTDMALHVSLGHALIDLQRWAEAEAALVTAMEFGRLDATGRTLRARARIEQDRLELAAYDVVAALRLDPHFVDALVLRGELIQRGMIIDMPN